MADRVITISEFSRRAIIEHHRLSPERIAAVHLCADDRYARSAAVARSPTAPLPARFIFYPANLWKHKNHDVLLRALRLLRVERGRRVDLVLTGVGQDDGYPLEAMVKSHGVSDQVHSLGYLAVEELAHLYQRADMLVFPALFEGFGIPLVEAMAAGCPVVAPDTHCPRGPLRRRLFDRSHCGARAAIEHVLDDETRRGAARARFLHGAAVLRCPHGVAPPPVRSHARYSPRTYLCSAGDGYSTVPGSSGAGAPGRTFERGQGRPTGCRPADERKLSTSTIFGAAV